ncbi:hypothetical protein RclHR1_02310011 [Rhizophagus clarus]|uniref:Transposase Tc1-like domain-containing protein n=1 Tax=Rhizophagus clarus TaxID=94130 RepID=A0A2Z6QXC4_9GLOM|nr:hypothetical protein RclHR1_02310011 [Rhizophagus clarus]
MIHISLGKCTCICILINEGYSSCYIVSKENVDKSSVIQIKQKVEATGSVKDLPKTADIQKKLKSDDQIDVSVCTVKRTLHRNGLSSKIKQKKPYLKKKHREQRLKFAKKYRNWSFEDWNKVIWSDESKFMIFGSDSQQYCWKKPGEPIRNQHVKPTLNLVVVTLWYGDASLLLVLATLYEFMEA